MRLDRRDASPRPARPPTVAALLLAFTMASMGACTAGGPSPTAMPTPPQASPSVPPPAQPSSDASGTPPSSPVSPSAALDVPTATKIVVDQLLAAVGNPDTGSTSEAKAAFDAALASGRATDIAAKADVILGHLADARATIAAVAGSGCPVFCPEWDRMLAEIATGIGAMRDAGIAHDPAAVETARTRIQAALLDHFWQGIRGGDPDAYVTTLRDGRIANASRIRWSTPAGAAFDGNETSAWTTGDASPPQWVEVDLGAAASLESIRLLTIQDVAGRTDHRVTACGADGIERQVARFAGDTADRQWLQRRLTPAIGDVRVVRVTTVTSPSTIGWREIQLGLGPGATAQPSAGRGDLAPCGLVDVTTGSTATGEPSAAGNEPARAIDDDPGTGWSPGTTGSMRIELPKPVALTRIRLLVGTPAGAAADYRFVAMLPSGERLLIGTLSGPTTAGKWRTLVNPTPSLSFSQLELDVRVGSPAAAVLELELIGRTLG